MRLNLAQEILILRIQSFGKFAREYRQVQKRLEQLLPDRLNHLVIQQRRRSAAASTALREALVSEEYLTHIEEVVEVTRQGLESRVQYETHMMLFEARRSLKKR